jgi:hypothetical protein
METDFGKFVTAEVARWGKVVNDANIRSSRD